MRFSFLIVLWTLGLTDVISGSPLNTKRGSDGPIVDLGYAKYEGTSLAAGVNQFLGMRYAAPPLGDLRFRAAQDPLPVDGVQSAQKVGR